MRSLLVPALLLAALFGGGSAHADPAPFDLAGPTLRASVTHGGTTLPIAQVPQLAAGDTITVRADLPEDQSAHYLLIAAFLRGSTNPPPDKWFFQAKAWTKKGDAGLTLTLPDDAQQVMLFLAPATGGDFPTLRNAVQGKPGAFVRAAQELAQASLDRSRLDAYLAAVRKTDPNDPDRLERITPLLARSLAVKINTDCLTKLPELQAACLLQNQESLVLNDGHSNAITDAVSGPGADLALQLSATPQGGLGYYSPYIAAIRDVIGIFSTIHTAKYQYIPALAALDGDRMALVLNAPPSFHNPKSVLVTALPVVAPVHVPPLQLVGASPQLCAYGTEQVLPMSGAPLVYATRYAHDLTLRVTLPGSGAVDLPASPDAERGGLVIRTAGLLPSGLTAPLEATLHGYWGFEKFDGPTVRLQAAPASPWRLASGSTAKGPVTLTGGASACVTGVTITAGDGEPQPIGWKILGPDQIAVTLPEGGRTTRRTIAVTDAGSDTADTLTLAAPAPPPGRTASLIARHVERPAATAPVSIALGSDALIPSDATLTFSLRAGKGARFTGKESIEIAADSGGGTATLTPANGLTLADPRVAVARIEPGKALGSSAFGPLRARVVADGVAGDWLSLGTLVRLPGLHQLQCPADAGTTCELSGDALFLLDAVSASPTLDTPVDVPAGYPGTAIRVPRPVGGALYVRLHDDPTTISRIVG